jgi:hypothetical protein
MCTSLARLVLIQDVTADVISTRSTLLKGILQDLSQLTDSALSTCLDVLFDTIESGTLQTLVGRGKTAQQYASALSMVLASGVAMPAATRDAVSVAIRSLLAAIHTDLAIGELPTSTVNDNLRIATALASPPGLQSAAFGTPVTDYEAFVGTAPTVLKVDPTNVPAAAVEMPYFSMNRCEKTFDDSNCAAF